MGNTSSETNESDGGNTSGDIGSGNEGRAGEALTQKGLSAWQRNAVILATQRKPGVPCRVAWLSGWADCDGSRSAAPAWWWQQPCAVGGQAEADSVGASAST